MAKFYGAVGYEETAETAPGVWREQITEREYAGDVLRNARRLQGGEQLNDNLAVSNEISIVADPYAVRNFHSIRYVTYMGSRWKVSNVTVQYPRLVLTLGELYNPEAAPQEKPPELPPIPYGGYPGY